MPRDGRPASLRGCGRRGGGSDHRRPAHLGMRMLGQLAPPISAWQALGQQLVQFRPAVAAECRQHVVVHRHAAAQPAIRRMMLAQTFDRPRRADPFQRRIQPYRQQHRRIARRTPGRVVARFDAGVEAGQIQTGNERPHQPRPMLRQQLAVQIDHLPAQLTALQTQQSRALARRESFLQWQERIAIPPHGDREYHPIGNSVLSLAVTEGIVR